MLADERLKLTRLAHSLLTERFTFRGSLRLAWLLARLIAPRPTGTCMTVATRFGFKMEIEPAIDVAIDRSIYYFGSYESGTIPVLQRILRPGDWFIDVGANIGMLSLVGAQAVGKNGLVWAIEPNPATFSLLERNVALNSMPQVHPINIAIGSTQGITEIRFSRNIKGGATLVNDPALPETASVRIDRLDTIIGTSYRPIELIKVDVEGWELEVVNGAQGILTASNAPILMIEFTMSRSYSGVGSVEMFYAVKSLRDDYRVFQTRRGKNKPSRMVEIHRTEDLPRYNNVWFVPRHRLDQFMRVDADRSRGSRGQ